MDIDKLINVTIPRIAWGVLGAGALCGVVFAGAWWHLFSAGLCLLMFRMHEPEEEEVQQ